MSDWITGWWADFLSRLGGPMTFRLILQPTMAALLALRSGIRDAREGRPAYFWSILTDPASRPGLIREGWRGISRVFVVAVVMDLVYQVWILKWFYPLQALLVAILLAVVPYLLIRGPVNRVIRRFRKPQRLQPTVDK